MEEVEDRVVPSWHAMTPEACIEELKVVENIRRTGLTSAQAAARLEEYGPNQLSEKRKVTLLEKIWHQVNNVLVAILVFVAAISLVRAITDDPVTNGIQVGIIAGVIIINTCIGIIQEGSAEKAAEALKAMLSSDAIVVRDGTEVKVPAQEIVPGDVVMLGLGDKIPADLRMIECGNLACAEAALTGESVPIDKMVAAIEVEGDPSRTPLGDRQNMCFCATLVAQGTGAGLVVSTGDFTEIGTINALVNKVEDKKTAVLEQIDTVSKWLAAFIVLTAIVTFSYDFWGVDPENSKWLDSLSIALVCAVAMIPEGLEAIVTVTYAWAVSNMAKKNAIIRALPAVETLGSVTVICSDKTGTLTQNVMSLTAFVTSNARYKFDVNSKERTNKNFVRDDSYMAERADHLKLINANGVVKGGASASRRGPRSKKKKKTLENDDFPFTMNSDVIDTTVPSLEIDDDEPSAPVKKIQDNTPVGSGESPELPFFRQALSGGVLCSKCTLGKDGTRDGEIGNPTELSILRAVYFTGVNPTTMKDDVPVIAEVPFSSDYKFMATIHDSREENDGMGMSGKNIVHVKGAPDRMIPMCCNQAKAGLIGETEPLDKDYWISQIAILSSHGLRVLALLRGSVDAGTVQKGEQLGPEFVQEKGAWLTMVGLCAIMDPPRPECVAAVRESNMAGVRVCMITGDHKDTALAIGAMLGLVDTEHTEAITGPDLDALSDDEMKKAAMKYNVFARASPQNKIRIVKALQAQGEIAGMTGDGVNDAPALKASDMGVGMGKEGTDVAREASDMILADDNFATIVVAIKEGRTVWDNLRKVLMINTPINNAQGLSVLFALIFGMEQTPLTAIQVLYCNLICAVTMGFVAAVEPAEDGIMEKPPRRVGKRLIGRFLFLRIALGTAILVFVTVFSSFWALTTFRDKELCDTAEWNALDPAKQDEMLWQLVHSQASNSLTFSALSITLSARFAYNSAMHTRTLYGNKFAWYSVLIVTVLQIAITYIPGMNTVIFAMGPMKWEQWIVVIIGMVVVFLVMELEKALRRYLSSIGSDTDDLEFDRFDSVPNFNSDDRLLPKGASRMVVTELKK